VSSRRCRSTRGAIAGPNAHSQRTAPPPASSTASSPPRHKRHPCTGPHVTHGNRGGVHRGFQEQRPWCGGLPRRGAVRRACVVARGWRWWRGGGEGVMVSRSSGGGGSREDGRGGAVAGVMSQRI
jgi:hypothetical protein